MNVKGEQLLIGWQSQLIQIHSMKDSKSRKEVIMSVLHGIAENYEVLKAEKWQDSAHLTFLVYNLQNIRARYGINIVHGEMSALIQKVLERINTR